MTGLAEWAGEVGSATSCWLNALARGPRVATFSAWSWALLRRGSRWGQVRVWLVDRLPGNQAGHCRRAWEWHVAQGYIKPDTA